MAENLDKRQAKRTAYDTLDAIKAAGLGPVKRKARTGLYAILGLLVLAVLGGGVYFGLATWKQANVEEQGDRPVPGTYNKLEDQHLSSDEASRIRSAFEYSGEPSPDRPLSVPRRKTIFERRLLTFYQDQKDAKHEHMPVEPRYTDGLQMHTGPVTGPGAMDKKEAVPTGPAGSAGPERLSNSQISAVVSKHRKRIKRRLERSLNRYPELAGKLVLVVRVRPGGSVERVHVETPKYHGTGIEEFLTKDVKHWKFPRFDGVPYDLTFPLILSGK